MRSKEGAARKLERDRERVGARVLHGDTLRFMGNEYVNIADLRKDYPAFAADDAIRAIRAGCETVTAVETYCWKRRNAGYLKAKAAAQRSQYGAMHALGKKKDGKRASAKRGGAATKAKGRAAA